MKIKAEIERNEKLKANHIRIVCRRCNVPVPYAVDFSIVKTEIPQFCFFLLLILTLIQSLWTFTLFLLLMLLLLSRTLYCWFYQVRISWSLLSMFTFVVKLDIWLSNFRSFVHSFFRSLYTTLSATHCDSLFSSSFYNFARWKVNILIVFMTRRQFQ